MSGKKVAKRTDMSTTSFDADLQGTVGVQLPTTSVHKRALEADQSAKVDDEPSYKVSRQPNDEDEDSGVAQHQDQQVPPPIPPRDEQTPPAPPAVQVVKRNPCVIYPDQYESFDPKLLAIAKDAEKSREGGGEIRYISYVYQVKDPETGVIRAVTKPLLINTPNGMYLPTGVTTWPDGKITTLLSMGRDWEMNPMMVQFKKICRDIQDFVIQSIVDKEWNVGCTNTFDAVAEQFTDFMFEGMGPKGEQYPPSIKASVIVTGKMRTEIFEFAPKPPLRPMIPAEVIGGSSITAIIHIPWIYRKKDGKKWKFSMRSNLFQGVVELPSSSYNDGGASTCSVVF